tara:strand:+ start:163 stop:489 length:327 start_codon:yes stop_codon:yes gene_type:complete
MDAKKYLESIGLENVIDEEFFNDDDKSWYKVQELMEAYHQSKVNNGVLVDVNEHNIAKYDYVWYNERLCKVTDMREWSKKDKGIRVEVLDLDSRKGYTVAISSLRYVR